MTTKYFVLAVGDNNYSSTGTWSLLADGSVTGAPVPGTTDDVRPSTSR